MMIKRKEILSILLDEFLEEMEERKEVNIKTRKKILSVMLNELLERVEITKDYIFNEFNELERDEEDLTEYIEALSYIENVINYFN